MIDVKQTGSAWNVFLEGKIVGQIKLIGQAFQYFPKGSKVGGNKFATLGACIVSLSE